MTSPLDFVSGSIRPPESMYRQVPSIVLPVSDSSVQTWVITTALLFLTTYVLRGRSSLDGSLPSGQTSVAYSVGFF